MSYSESQDTLAFDDKDHLLESHDPQEAPRNVRLPSHRKSMLYAAYIFLVVLLCGSNIITFLSLIELKVLGQRPSYPTAGIEAIGETTQTMHTVTDFSSADRDVSNAAWDIYNINGFVSLPKAWTLDRGLPSGRDMPGDAENSIYVVDGFHQIHCLMSIRSTVDDMLDGKPVENVTHTRRHLNHCYDALRQSIMCRADATPLYVPKNTFYAGDGQQRRCGNWEALQDWVVQHTACYGGVKC